MLNHLKSLGGSPFLNGESWDPSKFSLENIFIKEPASALYILLNYKFEAFNFPLTSKLPPSYYGLRKMDLWGSAYDEDKYSDVILMLEEINNLYLLDSIKKETVISQITKAVDRVISFRKVSRVKALQWNYNPCYISPT